MMCHISLERSQQRLQLCFKPCLNGRFAQEIMGFQNDKGFNFGNFGIPNLGVLGKVTFGCNLVTSHKEYYKGEDGDLFPKSEPCWVL